MDPRPAKPPPAPRAHVTAGERAAITAVLGELSEPVLRAVRDARGHDFQRLEFIGDAVLELVVRLHADIAGPTCPQCGGDADITVTDTALAATAVASGLGAWLEWQPSAERMADLVEACAGAVWVDRGWEALAEFTDAFVHPLAPLKPAEVVRGWHGAPPPPTRRGHEVLGASVIEVAAASLAFTGSSGDEGELTHLRNRAYATHRVVERAKQAGWLDATAADGNHIVEAEQKDQVDRRLADLALSEGLASAVSEASTLLR